MTVEWSWIERYAQQFAACGVGSGTTAVLLAESRSRPEVVDTTRLALASLGAAAIDVVVPTPPEPGPVPIRSTGASQALQGNAAVLGALTAVEFIADCTVEGLLHAPELGQILDSGARVLMISNEHPDNTSRWPHDPTLADRVALGVERAEQATQMRVISPAGTDLTISLAGAFVAGSAGWTTTPGSIAHWPGGLVVAFPGAGSVDGTLVLAPGDVNLSFKEYIRTPIRLKIESDYITDVGGDGHDAELLAGYLATFDERDAYAVSHVGWGMNPAARWESMAMWDKREHNGTELRAFAGNFLYSTGANEVAGRFCRGHVDLPMRHCTVELDGTPVVVDGELVPDLAE